LTAADIAARVQAVAATVADGPVVVHVGNEVHGFRNVGVGLPRRRRSANESCLLRKRVWAALEAAGVTMAETADEPKVAGDLLGNVRVRELAVDWRDASRLAGPAPAEREVGVLPAASGTW
jgi:hypothetical protein